jgi:hypothetical protein
LWRRYVFLVSFSFSHDASDLRVFWVAGWLCWSFSLYLANMPGFGIDCPVLSAMLLGGYGLVFHS